jgi:hypothetical protein
VTKERLEIAKLVWRVHFGEQALHTANAIDSALLHDARRISSSTPSRRSAGR